jgi:aldose 1-epimerase
MSIRSDVLHGSAAYVASGFFGTTAGGERVFLHTLEAATVRCLDFGGAVHSIEVPDRSGRAENVVLGFDGLKEYERDRSWCGVLCGPVAGRIAGASVHLGERVLSLEANEGTTCLHSGSTGFSKSVWKGMTFCDGQIAGFASPCRPFQGIGGFPEFSR